MGNEVSQPLAMCLPHRKKTLPDRRARKMQNYSYMCAKYLKIATLSPHAQWRRSGDTGLDPTKVNLRALLNNRLTDIHCTQKSSMSGEELKANFLLV